MENEWIYELWINPNKEVDEEDPSLELNLQPLHGSHPLFFLIKQVEPGS